MKPEPKKKEEKKDKSEEKDLSRFSYQEGDEKGLKVLVKNGKQETKEK